MVKVGQVRILILQKSYTRPEVLVYEPTFRLYECRAEDGASDARVIPLFCMSTEQKMVPVMQVMGPQMARVAILLEVRAG